MGKNLGPQAWIRYWDLGVPLGFGILTFGIVNSDSQMIFLGVATLFFTPAMIAFWRRIAAQQDHDRESN